MMKRDPIHLFSTSGVNVLTAKDQSDRIEALETENAQLRQLLLAARNKLVASSVAETTEIQGSLH